jgi:hypothetical protein
MFLYGSIEFAKLYKNMNNKKNSDPIFSIKLGEN